MPEYRKKLIEVALPLEAINKESAREKSIRHGHPSTLHLWWARRPLAACRAVLFAQMVDDPSSLPEEFPTEEAQETERQRLFRIIEEFVKWENITNETVLHEARVEIARSAARNYGVFLPRSMSPVDVVAALKQYSPPLLDPFAGGGSIPLEAQRLGLEAHASDLNPVAVLINKALIEIPSKFAGHPPINPESRKKYLHREWRGAEGLAEDVRYYGRWMRSRAEKSVGHLYPKVQLMKEWGGGEATVIAWLWARTIKCPNPKCGGMMPLLSTLWLSRAKGASIWLRPVPDPTGGRVTFAVEAEGGTLPDSPKVGRGSAFRCLICNQVASEQGIRAEFCAKRDGKQLVAIVASSKGKRLYLPAVESQALITSTEEPHWRPEAEMNQDTSDLVSGRGYGITHWHEIFTPRQLQTLSVFAELVSDARTLALTHSENNSYADAIATYLGLTVSKLVDYNSSQVIWSPTRDQAKSTFARQSLPMVWDFAEINPFAGAAGDITVTMEGIGAALERIPTRPPGFVEQRDAIAVISGLNHPLVSTDPPYYSNISYADLSDFFYLWLRHSIGSLYPSLFGTMLVPKAQELVAAPHRFGGDKDRARRFFEEGLGKAFSSIRKLDQSDYPVTVYYAFKQAENDEDEDQDKKTGTVTASTGWETMLEGLLESGFTITGTWPIRTERSSRSISIGTNALASSIILVCRPRPVSAPLISRRDFLNTLKRELPNALKDLQRGNIAPVDLAQAAIGPGMAVFSRYTKVLESDGTSLRVRTALQLINQALDEVLAEQEGEYDADTRWAVAWFEQYGMEEGQYGVAETLSKAKNSAVGALVETGILRAQGGKVRLLRRNEFSSDWNPATAKRLTVWEVTQRLIRALQEQGDMGAASILDHVGAYGELARDLAYRLYTMCERKKWADEALAYNSLVVEWSDISGAVEQLRRTTAKQAPLFS